MTEVHLARVRLTFCVRSFVVVSAAVAALGGCSTDHPQPTCPRNQPAFRLQLTAPDGRLPANTQLTVNYSGNRQETYSLATGGPMNTDVCCRTGDPTSGRLPDVRCVTPPSLSSLGPPPTPPRDGASAPPTKDASVRRGTDAATGAMDAASRAPARDGAVVSRVEAGVRDASTVGDGGEADAASIEPVALLCDLWTDGYADVRITASGYPAFEHLPFDPDVPDPRCGVVTVDLRIELGHNDAGLNPR
jgi:hypothetical protein